MHLDIVSGAEMFPFLKLGNITQSSPNLSMYSHLLGMDANGNLTCSPVFLYLQHTLERAVGHAVETETCHLRLQQVQLMKKKIDNRENFSNILKY